MTEFEDKIDHCSYAHNSSDCEIKPWKQQQQQQQQQYWGLNEIRTQSISAIPVQCSTNWAF